MERINFAQFRDKWPALVNTKTSSPVFKILEIYTLTEEMLTSKNWLCSTELICWLVSYLVSQSDLYQYQHFTFKQSVCTLTLRTFINVLWNYFFSEISEYLTSCNK